ncbi:MAG: hypothetical protein HQ567_07245 [Candidatus Nealsonbacteria bacterium]|nr:hypothetical protein [Candidatus Nealsonbacteria bacterium]
METIPFLVTLPDDGGPGDQKGVFGTASDVALQQLPIDKLKENLGRVSTAILSVLADIKQVGQFKLKEITLQVEVSADAGVNLIGTANLGGKGAITLKFTE